VIEAANRSSARSFMLSSRNWLAVAIRSANWTVVAPEIDGMVSV
jgi:hypothetical protein